MFDTQNSSENLPTLITELKNFSANIGLNDERKTLLLSYVEKIFGFYAEHKNIFQMEVSVIPAANSTTLIVRENGNTENPLNSLGRFFYDVSEKSYLISGDENKLVWLKELTKRENIFYGRFHNKEILPAPPNSTLVGRYAFQ